MELRIFDYGSRFEWGISFWLVDGEHRQHFKRTGGAASQFSKLDALKEAIEGLEWSLSELVNHIKGGEMVEIVPSVDWPLGKGVAVKLTGDWKIE